MNECDRQRIPARKPPKPTVATTTTTTTTPPTRMSAYSTKIPEPDWTQLKATWNQYAAAQRLQRNIAQTCICFD
ncbi:unnamed protein product [Trichobilharzia regenti]|nr:unnamed protein product [Trichobilharzia regenti]